MTPPRPTPLRLRLSLPFPFPSPFPLSLSLPLSLPLSLSLLTLSPSALADAQPIVPAQPQVVPASTVPRVATPAQPAQPAEPQAPDHALIAPPELPFEAKAPSYKVALTFDDADFADVVRTIGQLTGRRFVVASAHTKGLKATLFAPEKVSVAEAYRAFLAVLQSNGLTVIPEGDFWKIVDTQDVSKQATPVTGPGDAATGEERYVTRVLRLHHVNAEDITASVLGKFSTRDGSIVPYAPGNLVILTDTGENIRRMQRILEDVDVAAPGDRVWLEPLHYVSAAEVEKKLAEIFDVKSQAAGRGGATPSAAERLTRLVALDRPNALVVVGGEGAYARVLAFLQRIDLPVSNEGAIHVVTLEHTDAKEIVPAINEALVGAAPAARGGGGGEALSVLEAQVKVSAEETTNSILVTSSEHDFAAVREVIAKLDRPRRQVYIEAVVMDVGVEKDTAVGVQYHGLDSLGASGATLYGGMNPFASASQPGAGAASSLSDTALQALALGVRGPTLTALGMSIPAFGAFVQASTHTLDSDILQTPHIIATDNVQAEFHVTVNRSLQQNAPSYSSLAGLSGGSTAAAASSFLGTAPASLNYKALGPQIKITPHLNESDDVRLDIIETISDTTGVTEGSLGTLPFTERGATTTLTVHDQQTTVIGGLVADKVSHEAVKIPILGDIPILGALFRHTSEARERTNLVLVLTPYILRDQADMRRIVERRMEERQELLDHQALFSDRPWRASSVPAEARGILRTMRRSSVEAEEEIARQAALAPRPPIGHEPSAPLELPALAPASSAAPPADARAAAKPRVEK